MTRLYEERFLSPSKSSFMMALDQAGFLTARDEALASCFGGRYWLLLLVIIIYDDD